MEPIKPYNKAGKIGLFFGSFNPITKAHMFLAEQALFFGIDEVWFVVSPHNPQKFKKGVLAHENHRWNMVNLAVDNIGNEKIKATNIEFFQKKKPSFTHITLQQLQKENPLAEFIILCGTDTHHKIVRWRNAKWIHENFEFWVFPRENGEHLPVTDELLNKKSSYLDMSWHYHQGISATEVRNALKEEINTDHLIIHEVAQYIKEHDVYSFVKAKT